MNGYIYLVISLISFFFSLVCFSFILFIVFKNKECKVKENNLKKEWNELALYDFEKINLPIEHISFMDEKFEKIIFLFNDFSSLYQEKMDNVKSQIYKLPKTLNNYDWKSFNIIHSNAQLEMSLLKSSLASLFGIQHSLLEFKDYISYILVSYRENSWDLINFYNSNLADDSKDIKHIKEVKTNINILRNSAENLDLCIENFDINIIEKSIDDINNSFCCLWESINKMFIHRKQNNYINYSINEINNILKNNYKTIKPSLVNEAEKRISKVMKNEEYIKLNYEKISESENQKITISIIKSLWDIKKDLNITFKSSEFFNKHKTEIDNLFSIMDEYIPNLIKIFKKMYENFAEDLEMNKLLQNCKTKFEIILSEIFDYKKEINNNNYNPFKLLEKAKDIIEKIVENVSNADNAVSEAVSKYNISKTILNDIASNKLLLTQMKAFMIKNKVEGQDKYEWIDKLSKELDNIERKFFTKKNSIHHNEYNIAALAETKSEILKLRAILMQIQTMKDYTEKIINYACLKMSLDSTLNYNLEKSIKLYDQGKYKESALSILMQMKNN